MAKPTLSSGGDLECKAKPRSGELRALNASANKGRGTATSGDLSRPPKASSRSGLGLYTESESSFGVCRNWYPDEDLAVVVGLYSGRSLTEKPMLLTAAPHLSLDDVEGSESCRKFILGMTAAAAAVARATAPGKKVCSDMGLAVSGSRDGMHSSAGKKSWNGTPDSTESVLRSGNEVDAAAPSAEKASLTPSFMSSTGVTDRETGIVLGWPSLPTIFELLPPALPERVSSTGRAAFHRDEGRELLSPTSLSEAFLFPCKLSRSVFRDLVPAEPCKISSDCESGESEPDTESRR